MILLKLKFIIKKSSYYTAQLPCRLRGHPENQNPNPHNASSLLRICGSQGPVYAYYATSFRLSVHARRVQHRQGSGCQVVRLMRCGGVKTRSRDSGRGKSANSLRQQLQLLLLVPTCAGFTVAKVDVSQLPASRKHCCSRRIIMQCVCHCALVCTRSNQLRIYSLRSLHRVLSTA